MKTLTIVQPYAELILTGLKTFETRSWQTTYRGIILLHSSKTNNSYLRKFADEHPLIKKHLPPYERLTFGAIVGCARIVDIAPASTIREQIKNDEQLKHELDFGHYSDGGYAWKLADVHRLMKPIFTEGKLMLWDFNDTLIKDNEFRKIEKITL